MFYKATKNLFFSSLNKSVIVDEVIDLDPDYAKKVNEDLKLTFPDVKSVLVSVDEVLTHSTDIDEIEKPKKTTRRKKADVEAETVAEDEATE